MRLKLALIGALAVGPAWAGQVPFPVNAPASAASGNAVTYGANPQQAADSGISLSSDAAHAVLIGPTSGGAAAPTFRVLAGADLPNPSATTLGGIESKTCPGSQWITQISTAGVVTCSQPAFSDISGVLAAAQLPNPTASTLGGVESKAAVSHQWLNAISTSGVPSASQPASSDLSDTVARTTFTPTIDFTTHGDLTVSYSTQNGAYAKVGPITCLWESLVFTATGTTYAGNLTISAPPVTPTDANAWAFPVRVFSSPTWPGSTATMIGANWTGSVIQLQGLKSGAAASNFAAASIVSGTAYTLVFSGCFF